MPVSFTALGFLNTEVFNLASLILGAKSSLFKFGSTMLISAGLAGGLFGMSLGYGFVPLGNTVFSGHVPISELCCFGGSSHVPSIMGFIKKWGLDEFKAKFFSEQYEHFHCLLQ